MFARGNTRPFVGPEAEEEIETKELVKLSFIAPVEEPSIFEMIGAEMRKLQDRIVALEKRDWNGIWTEGKSYSKGAIISHDGSAWTAIMDYPQGKPSEPKSGWKLFVKRGRDGK